MESSDKTASSPANTPPIGNTSPFPTPPATPARRGDFTRAEYAWRHQLRIMDDLDKMLQQKSSNQGRSPVRKTRTRARPRSVTREETKLSLSPAKKATRKEIPSSVRSYPKNLLTVAFLPTAPKMTKSHSSLNLAATDVPGNDDGDKKIQRCSFDLRLASHMYFTHF